MKGRVGSGRGSARSKRGLDIVPQVAPVGVLRADQLELPLALPLLHRLLARDGLADVGVAFGVGQAGEAVFGAEFGAGALAVLVNAGGEVGGDADVERAVGGVGHDVDPAAAFHISLPVAPAKAGAHLSSPRLRGSSRLGAGLIQAPAFAGATGVWIWPLARPSHPPAKRRDIDDDQRCARPCRGLLLR